VKIKKHQALGMAGIFVGHFMASTVAHFSSWDWRLLVLFVTAIPGSILMAAVEIYFENREKRNS